MSRLLDNLLKHYPKSDFSVRMKAEFLLYVCVIAFFCFPLIMIYTGYNQASDHLAGSTNNYVLLPHILAMLLILIILHNLYNGRFTFSAHMFLIIAMFTAFMIMILERTSPISRLDTIVYLLPIISITSLVIRKHKMVIFAYGLVCIIFLVWFMIYSRNQLGLSVNEIFEYIADNTFAIIFTCIVAYSLFTINKKALDRAEDDIAQRKRAEVALKESQQQLRDLIDFLPDATFAIDTMKQVIVWNRAMEMLTGVLAIDIVGKGDYCYAIPFFGDRHPLLIDYVQDPQDVILDLYPDLKIEGDSIIAEMFVPKLRKRGAHVWAIAKPLYNSEGHVVGAIESLRDITERKQAEEEKTRLEDQLRQAQKMESIGRLAGGVAHDFNNLLTAILGSTEISLHALDQTNPLYKRLTVVKKAAESAAEITRQLLAFSRKQIIEPKVIDLNELIDHTRNMLTWLIGEDIKLRTNPQVPLGLIKADPGQIEQIIVNLAVNARDAMPDGGELSIATSDSSLDEAYCQQQPDAVPGKYVVLIMSDTGSGMTDEVKEHLFEPFFTTKPKEKGTGLGLATIYGAVKQHRGSIEVISEPGKGTTFKVFFPCVTDGDLVQQNQKPDTALPEGTETILLVEDNSMVLDFALNALKDLGYKVIQASNGEDAISLAERHDGKIHILVSDVILPRMNGKALADRLVHIRPEMSVLFTSGYSEDLISHHGVLEDGIHFINKPYTAYALARKIRDVLGKDVPVEGSN
jgi:signal transduction histidine kinase/ActR/RegA family two-component response regulator